ncbi:GreA/GreB family elongation factor [Mycobacterium sp. 852002-10029_SCH5224772]|uniref:GreA/GreB family elongation factor n=1 Tax=Mycobacterium sp. 852002-10029_SCH5224772 TaxID=1834083 RepID=UPI0009EF13BE|nr:GreA/GreB family elongation factor [Mycobacterium sp. 852002-10029_SCH5224772]
MTTIQRFRMTPQQYTRLHDELAGLRSRRGVEVPDDLMDYNPNRRARQSVRRARISQIEGLLSNAVVVGEGAAFDPVAEAGMVLTIRYDDTGETETFLLGRPCPEDAGIKAYSMASPLGRAMAGARPGDERFYAIPDGTGRCVTLLKAVPYGMYAMKSRGPQLVMRRSSMHVPDKQIHRWEGEGGAEYLTQAVSAI